MRYLLLGKSGVPQHVVSEAFSEIAEAMEKSKYSAFRKLLANVRAAGTTQVLNQRRTNSAKATGKFEKAALLEVQEVLRDAMMPPNSAADAMREVIAMVRQNREIQAEIETSIFPVLIENWRSNTFAFAIPARYFIDKAWRERGYGGASTVTEKRADQFVKNLLLAEARLKQAWDTIPADEIIPLEMITVCMGLGRPRNEMELWFNRAMEINPNSYEAVNAKAYYLEPKWMGSEKELLSFGSECVASTKWGGRTPLALRDAHEALRQWKPAEEAAYYSRPEVWKDFQASYEKFFELNPKDISQRHKYAKAAYQGGRYKIFREQI